MAKECYTISNPEAGGYQPQEGDIKIRDPQAQFRGFYSAYFIGPKKDGGYSNIVDVSGLNKFLKILPFHMREIYVYVADALQTIACGDWFKSIELNVLIM